MLNVVCAIIIERNKILITQNGPEATHPFKWEFPGGKIERGESGAEALTREIKEELDVEILPLKELNSVTIDSIRLIPFLCKRVNGTLHLNEHIDSNWMRLEELDVVDFSVADRLLLSNTSNWNSINEYIGIQ